MLSLLALLLNPQILANALIMIKSFAQSFKMDIHVVFPSITMHINLFLPNFLKWFPNIFSNVLVSFSKIFAKISFTSIALNG